MRLTIQLRITVALLCMAVWNVAAWSIAAEIDLRQPAVPPADSIKQFTVPAGLEISLFASESDVQQPLSISFDDRGRMWVVQYIQYPNPAGLKAIEVDQYLRTKYDRVPEPPPRGPKGADRITIYEDTNGDGKPDKIKDFLSDLNLCSGVEVGYGGVFVIQAPYLLFYADRNQDDIPDGDPEVLLSGFGMNDAHAVANSLTWGPDGWLYGAQGSTVTANVRGIEFQQGIWRYHPVTKQFELFAEGGGNTWGIDFDRFGNLFAGGNTVQPLCHHVPGGYYVKGFGKHGPLHNPFTYGYFNAVQHFGYKGNGLTGGFIFYYGGAFPKELDGAVLYPNIRQSCARWARLEELGTTFATRYGGDFIQSKDIGFRPVDMAVGPDGATYVADWYDFHIAHRDPHDSRKYYPPRNKDGRVWKVSPTGTATQPLFTGKPLRKRTSAELVNLLSNKNAWYSRQARLILAERRDKSILPQLNELMFQTNSQELALQGLWAHYVTADIDDDLAARLLNNSGPYVRSWTIRLLGDKNSVSPSIAAKFVTLAKSDPSPIVRSQLASTAKRLPGAVALPILAQLLVHDADMQDTNLPLLIWWAIENKAISDRKAVLDIVTAAGNRQHPLVQTTVGPRLARRYLAENNDAGFKSVATLLAAAADKVAEKALIVALDEELAGRALVKVPAPLQPWLDNLLQSSTLENVSLRLALRLGHPAARDLALKIVNDPKAAEEDRLQLIRALSETNHTDAIIAILQLLGSNQDDQIKSAILAAVERSDQPQIAGVILQ
ncbi:MAG: PVC-type heme-binding CxxCH protein, partial [Planctomycetota bacterium]|nr:PVC-type heme-binding CxxCH protein [Planctomycetota bacterium]